MILRRLALLLCMACGVTGCGGAMKSTMVAELSLKAATSLCYRTIDGVDKIKAEQLSAEYDRNPDAARADYQAYKPKIERARNACNTADDVGTNAEAVRSKLPTGGDEKQFTAWLPALSAALVAVQQAISDVKGLVQ